MKGERHKARVLALQALYEADVAGHDAGEALERLLDENELSQENRAFTRHLVSGVIKNQPQLDEEIQKHAPAWPVKQIAAIDRNILRLAIFEVLLDNSVPVKVAINEAVELAKSFGGDNSPSFINGVLGSVSTEVTRQ